MAIKKITSRHQRMLVDLVVRGMTPGEISLRYDLSLPHLTQIRKSPLFLKAEETMRDDVLHTAKSQMSGLVPAALLALEDAVSPTYEFNGEVIHNDLKTRLAAAKEVLNRNKLTGDDVMVATGGMVRVVISE